MSKNPGEQLLILPFTPCEGEPDFNEFVIGRLQRNTVGLKKDEKLAIIQPIYEKIPL